MMAWSALGQFLGARGDTAVTRSCSGGAILTRHIISSRRPVPRARARLRDLGDVALGRRPRPQRPRAAGDASADRRAAAGAAAFARCVLLTPVVQRAASCSHSGRSASTARSPFGRRRGDVARVLVSCPTRLLSSGRRFVTTVGGWRSQQTPPRDRDRVRRAPAARRGARVRRGRRRRGRRRGRRVGVRARGGAARRVRGRDALLAALPDVARQGERSRDEGERYVGGRASRQNPLGGRASREEARRVARGSP